MKDYLLDVYFKFKLKNVYWAYIQGTFPDDWKLVRVTPVYKNNGDVNIMSNYRPISVIGHIAKMVEQLVRSQLVSYLEEHAFIFSLRT